MSTQSLNHLHIFVFNFTKGTFKILIVFIKDKLKCS